MHFLTDHQINYIAMKHSLASLWRPGKGVSIKEAAGKRYMFQFYHPIDVKRVLDVGPWAFNNHLLILHQIRQGEIPTEIPLYHILIWVQVYDVPVGYMSTAAGKQIGNFVGTMGGRRISNYPGLE